MNLISKHTSNVICSVYPYIGYDSNQNVMTDKTVFLRTDGLIFIKDTSYTDVTAFKTAVTGQTLVYELAEPYTIQLTPEHIRLFKGTNNISCNTGDLTIKYYPDNVLGQLKGDIESEYDGNPKLPEVTSADNGKFLRVVNGSWVADTVPSAESQSF